MGDLDLEAANAIDDEDDIRAPRRSDTAWTREFSSIAASFSLRHSSELDFFSSSRCHDDGRSTLFEDSSGRRDSAPEYPPPSADVEWLWLLRLR